jgi:hypothetical protein
MSVTVHRTDVKCPATTGRAGRAAIASAFSEISSFLRRTVAQSARLLIHAAQAIAEARMQRALIEAELYRNRYKHSSKNDDDLPIVR